MEFEVEGVYMVVVLQKNSFSNYMMIGVYQYILGYLIRKLVNFNNKLVFFLIYDISVNVLNVYFVIYFILWIFL